MNYFIVFFICLLSLISSDFVFPENNNIITITDKTFGYALKTNKYLLVYFYTENCEECKTFLPELEKIAGELVKENIFFGKIDCKAEPTTALGYSITKYPTIIFFQKGNYKIINYTGKFEKDELLNFIKKESESKYTILNTEKELEEFNEKHTTTLIYFGSDEKEKHEFSLAERRTSDISFGVIESKEIIDKYTNKKHSSMVTLFKKFDELRNDLTEITSEKILNLIENYSNPKVMDFDTTTASFVFSKYKPALVVFAEKNSKEYEQYKKILYPIAEKFLGKIKVYLTDGNEGLAIKLSELMGVHEDDMPTVRIIQAKDEIAEKFRMKGEINEKNIIKFVEDWENKKIKPYLRTEEEPEDNDREVFILVGKSFKKEVLSNDKDVLIFFFAPWCKYCKNFYPKYEELAKKIKDKNPKLLIAKMDATENDIEDFPINRFPTVEFYPGNKKDQKPLHFNYKDGINELINFLKQNAYNKINIDNLKIDEPVLLSEENEEL